MEMNDIVKLAVDNYRGCVQKYSKNEANEVLRQALIDMNGGSTKLDYKAIRDGKCAGLFALIEQILDATVVEGLQNNDFFMSVVDFRNVALGDQNEFVTRDSNLFVVDECADGTLGIRRQRLGGENTFTIPTSFKMVRIYEEMNRVLSGRVDFNEMINKVSESFQKKILDDIYAVWTSLDGTKLGGNVYYVNNGSYSETDLLDLIAHVEAAAGGRPATIFGTKKALRVLAPSITSGGTTTSYLGETGKNDIYNMGYFGRFFGTPTFALPQRHQINSTSFVLPDDVLMVVAGDDKFIKFVYEGDPIMKMVDPFDNADLTNEYYYGVRYGLGVVLAGNKNTGIGRYEM